MRSLIILAALFPGAALAQAPSPEDVLDALYRTVALVQFCDIAVDPVIAERLARTGFKLERSLGINMTQSELNVEHIKSALLAVPPDCSPSGPDVGGVYRILAP